MRSQSKRILIFRIGELGDTLIALPALRAIRSSFPEAHIALLSNASSNERHVTARQILPANGLIDEWLSYSSDTRSRLADSLSLIRRLRRNHYDLLVYLGPRIRSVSDVRRDLLFFRLSGIHQVIGHHGLTPLPPPSEAGLPPVEHETDHLLQRISLGNVSVPPSGNVDFDLELSNEEQETAAAWLSKHVLQVGSNQIVGFGPGSKWSSKVWPEERFAEVGRRLIAEANIFPIVFGGSEDRDLGERLLKVWGMGANAAGALNVRQAAAALSHCRMYVGNDTGTMHLAAAVRIPCVAIMSALDWPGHWSPYGSGHTVLRRHVPCEGCMLSVCTTEGLRCLKEIGTEEVVSASLQTLMRPETTVNNPFADRERRSLASLPVGF